MLKTIKERLGRDDEQGFTLIELMVVLLIIAILLAIAIPTFLGARNTANARSTQSNLRNALTAEQTAWTNGQAFADASTAGGVTTLQGIEPSLNWVGSAATTKALTQGTNTVLATVQSGNTSQVTIAGWSKDGNCYVIEQSNDPAGSYTGYYHATTVDAAHCTPPAGGMAAPGSGGWTSSF